MNLFKLLLFILFAILPIAEHSYTSERTLKVDLSAEEEKILARGWTQQEIKQESDAFCANPTEPEETSAKVEYWRKLFFGSGITEFSRCFRKYTQKYMEKFLSPDGILTDEPKEIYANLPIYNGDLTYIERKKLPLTEQMILNLHTSWPIGGQIFLLLDQEKSNIPHNNLKFYQIMQEQCFWLMIYQAPFSVFDDYYDGSHSELISYLKYFCTYDVRQENKKNEKSCCNLL